MSEVVRGARAVASRLVELLEDQTITADQFVDAEAVVLGTPDGVNVEMTVDYDTKQISIKAGDLDIGFF